MYMETKAQRRATLKYKKNHYKRVSLDLQKDFYNDIKNAAQGNVSGYIKEAIRRRLNDGQNKESGSNT